MTEHPTLAAAVAALQADLPVIPKSETANVPTKQGGSYSYTYAGLATITAAVMPRLAEHGLSFVAKPTFSNGQFVLAYSLLHTSGDREDGEYPLPSSGGPQAIGSAITYGRRYCLCAATGVAPEDDDDGAAAEAEQQASKGTARRAATPRQQQGQLSGNGTAQRASAKKAAPAPEPPLPGEERGVGYPPSDSRHLHDTDAGGNCRNAECDYSSEVERASNPERAYGPPSAYSAGGSRPAGADDPATQQQLGKLGATFRESGVEREEGLAYVASVIGRQVGSTKELTKKEASTVIDALDSQATWQEAHADAVPGPADLEGTEA